jgi:type IV pilus assembly protein PilQ
MSWLNMMSQWFRPLRLAFGGTFYMLVYVVLGGPVWAQNQIQSVQASLQAGIEVIKVDFAQPLAADPRGWSMQTPPRIAFDFPATTQAGGPSYQEVNLGNLRSLVVAQAGDRSRLVLNLKTPAPYKTRLQDQSLLIYLESAPETTNKPLAGTSASVLLPATQTAAASLSSLKDIDFRLGSNGSGRVEIRLSNPQVGVDVRPRGQSLVVELANSDLPQKLRRRLDVTDFNTPVQTVSALATGDRVRLVIDAKGNWEHTAYQADDLLVVEVRPQRNDPSKLTQGPGYGGEKLSLNFQNIEIRALLQVIADFTSFNIVTSDSVSGALTLRLQDVPWDQALDIILQAKSLGVRKTGNVLWVAPNEEIVAKEKLEREAYLTLEGLEQMRTQSFQLNYAKAADIARQLQGQPTQGNTAASGKLLSTRGSVVAEPRTNQLFVTDVVARLDQVRELIVKIDVPVKQVLIEARIVEADDSFGRAIGVRLGGGPSAVDVTTSGGAMLGGTYSSTAAGATAGSFVNLPATIPTGVSFMNASVPAIALSIFNEGASRFLNLELSALEADNKGKVISSPRVITADKVKALIEQGTELPYQVATSSGATSIAFRKANLKLEVTPQITPEGSIILELDVNKDTVGQSTTAGFAIDTKHIQTQVLVENGGTVVIGGIYTMDEVNQETKVPLLGDIPYLGYLFKTKSKKSIKKEMLVFITPKTLAERSASR